MLCKNGKAMGEQRRHPAIGYWRMAIALMGMFLVGVAARPCMAQFTTRDGQIIARSLSFIEPGLSGVLQLGIVYAPNQPVSARQAQSLASTIGDGLIAGKITLKARLVPIEQLATASGFAGGLEPQLDDVQRVSRQLHVPTISTEMAYLRSDHCMLGFSSEPTVEIVLNHNAANSAGVHFNQAFRMLVREL